MAFLLLEFGCASARARAPAVAPGPVPTQDTAGAVRQELEQVNRRLDELARRSEDLENALARLGARAEVLERRIEQLAAQLAHARASGSPPPSGGSAPGGPPASGSPPSGPTTPGARGQPPGSPAPPGVSSGPAAEELFAAGMAKYRAGESDAAVLTLYELVTSYPDHPLRERAQFLVGDVFFSRNDLRSALAEFEALLAAVPRGTKTPEALLKIGLCHRGLGDETSAQRAWQRLVKEYPNSEAAHEARRLLRGARRR